MTCIYSLIKTLIRRTGKMVLCILPYYLANLPANRCIERIFFAKFVPILTKLCMLGLKFLQPNKLQKTVDEDPARRSTLDLDRERSNLI